MLSCYSFSLSPSWVDCSTQILFNRSLAYLGVAAFTNNLINEAHNLLSEIVTGRTRELLAQGVSYRSSSDRNLEQERAERRRQVVNHQHISLDLLEAIYFTCAMLLEVPNMNASDKHGKGKKVISRQFRKYNDIYTRVLLVHKPPETIRDHIMLAAHYLMEGNWKESHKTIVKMEVWALLPSSVFEDLEKKLLQNIKVEGLRTYLLSHSKSYESLALSQLELLFELNARDIHCIVSKMILSHELTASWDSVARCIIFHNVEPTTLQNLSIHYIDKLHGLVEANERLLDAKFQTSRNMQDKDHGKGNWHGSDRRNDHRRGGQGDYRRGGHGDYRRGGQGDNRRGGNSDYRKGHQNKSYGQRSQWRK